MGGARDLKNFSKDCLDGGREGLARRLPLGRPALHAHWGGHRVVVHSRALNSAPTSAAEFSSSRNYPEEPL